MTTTEDLLVREIDNLLSQDLDEFILESLLKIKEDYTRLNKRMERILKVSDRNERKILDFNELLEQRVEEELTKRLAIEKEKEAQERLLIQQSKMAAMGEMIGAIAHQWRQPLNTIMILAQNLPVMHDFNELNSETIQKEANSICSQVKFMDQTIDDFREFFKPSKEMFPFNMMDAILSINKILEPQMKKFRIHIGIEGDDKICAIGYPNEFKQVILNLMNNARDIMIEKKIPEKTITIKVFKQDKMATVTVLDNGGGIPSELLPDKLFEPYISTKGDQGTGIGLSMSKTIIEVNMHGKMYVENKENGACFTVALPCE